MKKLPILLFMLILCSWSAYARQADVVSPDKRLRFRISCGDSLEYRVEYKGKPLIGRSCIGLDISQLPQGAPVVLSTSRRSVNGTIRPLYGKTERLSDRYNELRIDFAGGWALLVRAYDEGVAYRFVTELPGRIVVRGESANFNIPDDPGVLFPETAALTAWELAYVDYQNLSAVEERTQAITPVLLSRKDGVRTVIAEADVRDYPGMYLVKTGRGLHSAFAAYPDSVAMGSWGNFVSVVRSRKEHIAETSGRREFPWRVIMATDDDRTLLTNELIYKLASPQAPGDFSWVRPGKAAWEWWHDAMLPGASVPSGMNNRNTALYKHYIDFAAENNLEYLMIDAGWSDIFDLSKVNPQVDIKELMRYAKQKDVGVFLWCVAHTLVSDPDRYMRLLSEWGVAGLKVDFFDRDDQIAMQWYEELARKAAEYKLLLNYHGCSKPTGMQRLYPQHRQFRSRPGRRMFEMGPDSQPRTSSHLPLYAHAGRKRRLHARRTPQPFASNVQARRSGTSHGAGHTLSRAGHVRGLRPISRHALRLAGRIPQIPRPPRISRRGPGRLRPDQSTVGPRRRPTPSWPNGAATSGSSAE